jgi:3-hydroxyisobutyrate dehydrogenase-like beta-hydroxyacid dehydrogenase
MRIGFVGVGMMGHGAAKNIVEKGFPLSILGHRNRQPVEDLIRRGATEAKTATDMARDCDVIFICVTGTPQVEEVVFGENGLLAGIMPGTVVAECSTAMPESTLKIAAAIEARGGRFLDMPCLYDVVTSGGADSIMFRRMMKNPLEDDDTGLMFAIRNMHKDLTYFLRMAEALPAHAAMAETARQSVTLARLAGFDEAYVPRLYDALCRLNGPSIWPANWRMGRRGSTMSPFLATIPTAPKCWKAGPLRALITA